MYHGLFVSQGNGRGVKIIRQDPYSFLFTRDLSPCIAIVIISCDVLAMIHSDSNGTNGVQGISLQSGLIRFNLSSCKQYSVYLFGGSSDPSNPGISMKFDIVKKILPNARLLNVYAGAHNAYASTSEICAQTKQKFAYAMGINVEDITI